MFTPLRRRPRRLRASATLRRLVRETSVTPDDLILPLFVSETIAERAAVGSMPGVFQLTVAEAAEEAAGAWGDGVRAVLLFGIPRHKDEQASGAYDDGGIVQQAVRAIRAAVPGMLIITDVCLCEYMSHGHCGVTHLEGGCLEVLNDASLKLLAKTALSHAAAGADIVAPSDMMDGRVAAIREALDGGGFEKTAIMSYAAKFASAFYGPFRDAAQSAPQAGDRKGYQMDPGNALEALREVALDVEEAADFVMVKPGLAYLDVLWRVKERFEMPTAVYHVSGEYAMVKAAAANGWLDERATVLETMTAFKRAGADLIITYAARDVARWVAEDAAE
ncbi:MAG TPA: porphobilinogen synthase [Chthoniobacteraceae bacterium]|nr:porphobilinogen synthase [Chthoniobacteraceae bacterium]